MQSPSARFRPSALVVALLFVFAVGMGAQARPALAAQAGYNVCLNQGHTVYKSANVNSPSVGWVSYYNVWHHYHTEGNWSLGYVRGNPDIKGYIPLGTFQYTTSDEALSCH